MKRIIVAHYKEDLSWLNKITCNYTIYHKNNNLNKFYDYNQTNTNEINLANYGKEAHTYLMHIINNYDNLYDVEIFTQGNPDHIPNSINVFNSYPDNSELFVQFSPVKRIQRYYGDIVYPHENDERHGELIKIYKKIFKKDPPTLTTMSCHAIFAVSKSRILFHAKQVYEDILNTYWEYENIYHNGQQDWPIHMEYFWHLIFMKEYHQ